MSKDEPLPIVFYRTSGGDEPVRDWLLSLTADVRKEIGGDIRNVQDGWPMGKPETMVLLHGFQKKTQKTPAAEIKLARRRQKEVTSP